MKPPPKPSAGPVGKGGLHPRNRHGQGYDFPSLVAASPDLLPFVKPNAYGNESVDFADPAAVKALNRALLQEAYGIRGWELPAGCLCPPIPGRADYLHHLADLLASCCGGVIPRGSALRILDLGVGASAIYPLLGHREYGWSFLGTDTDPAALAAAGRTLAANPGLAEHITLRFQRDPRRCFEGVLQPQERFDATLCNPPFYASLREAKEATRQKWQKLGRAETSRNFGGQGAELWCDGGELGFVSRMIQESTGLADRVAWFTTLIASSRHLPALQGALRRAEARDIRTLPMAQGQKQSRVVAWSFLAPRDLQSWAQTRWQRPSPEGA